MASGKGTPISYPWSARDFTTVAAGAITSANIPSHGAFVVDVAGSLTCTSARGSVSQVLPVAAGVPIPVQLSSVESASGPTTITFLAP